MALTACGGGGDGVSSRSYTLRQLAVGETRFIPEEEISVEMTGVNASHCPPTAKCPLPAPGVFLLVRKGATSESLTLLAGGADSSVQQTFDGLQFVLDNLTPGLSSDPVPPEQYRADITVRRP